MNAFQSDQEVFLESGQVCIYVAYSDGEHIVRPIFERDDSEPHIGKPLTVREVFASEPIAKYSENIAKAHAELNALQEKIAAARAEANTFAKDERERKDRLAAHNLLGPLDDFLAGRITHAVVERYGMLRVKTVAAAKEDREFGRYDRALISLRETSARDGRLTWQMESAHGANNWCTSAEAAAAVAQAILEQRCKDLRNPSYHGPSLNPELVETSYRNIGATCPADIAEMARQQRESTAERSLTQARTALAQAEAAHAKTRGEAQ